ncbi:ADP-ribosyl cyclase/cyclic ADP-ribose hydrolase 1-like [Centropristis striata]|uniref:ADP-ribosyl cyclase/cyclic ADP-ribose hydrolase 1-like n=1 Tax=Centropristis striata TaxID=184440 RepID=UPI0027E1461B|nr:ADP-ribosyl cyclase/cyclic ADP-ribose hydrolase 1-like [Centropristis striata]
MKGKVIGGGVTVLLVLVILLVLFIPRTAVFRKTFKGKCGKFPQQSHRCEVMLRTFEYAYVGKDPRYFPESNYDQFLNDNPFTHDNSKTMLWSSTKGLVHDYAEGTGCFITLEDTLLGSIMDGLTWCGLKGSEHTFDLFCKIDPRNNPVISFWRRVSARFAAYAGGVVTAMLDGSQKNPYDPKSVFAIEVNNLHAYKVSRLDVVLLTDKENVNKCDNESLQNLRNIVNQKGIDYNCKSVARSRVRQCIKENVACGACW